ncbi:restriction endonuclease [Nostoc sp. CENA67]|uniref:Restriction endonuclease n=1 Tax=Amazonocrinis nigriterrae CENA67 TaxID=2794033 RepID=A0A8J7HSL8_9NOST|nr:restriction endonuclease [Amazonocrinis nigriterrae]MBH8562742.1 restriction endonuclease [Amazonocrinis nigriterrae CENA67]
MSQLDQALRQFEAVEANLVKLENLWNLLQNNIPEGIVFGVNPDYEDACRSYEHILTGLPLIDGWKPTSLPCSLDEIAQDRLDAHQVGVLEFEIEVERRIQEPGKELREYRFHFNQKRRKLVQNTVLEISHEIDQVLDRLQKIYPVDYKYEPVCKKIEDADWQILRNKIKQIDVLLGSSVPRTQGWNDIKRHISYAQINDLRDIVLYDWPSIKKGFQVSLYTANEPISVEINDLAELVASKPSGSISTRLNWEKLSAENFERLIFNLLTSEKQSYQNPEWLMHTNAPDRGRDLSVYRVYQDQLSGTIRKRIIIQCKHWLTKSVPPSEIIVLQGQVKLWEPPRVDILVIATTGRFTSDAVSYVEKHNQSDSAMTIELWPESHLESILASNPALVAEFGLR